MPARKPSALFIGALLTVFGLIPEIANAQQFEKVKNITAASVLGAKIKGPNYVVQDTVRGDGLLNIFTVDSNYGKFTIHGNFFMEARIRELNALIKLGQIEDSDTFVNAAVEAGKKPLKFAQKAVEDPVGAVGGLLSGVGAAFGRISAGISNPGANEDGVIAGLAGISSNKRELAVKLRVDPYTRFKPLEKKLYDVASTGALGQLGVAAVLMAVPGVGGAVVSGASTSQSVADLVENKTAAQLRDYNRDALGAMGVSGKTTERFLSNKHFTPANRTVIVNALKRLSKVKNRAAYIVRAAKAKSRDMVYFHSARVNMIADYHKQTNDLSAFITVGGVAFNRAKDGHIIGLFPFDRFGWTKVAGGAVEALTSHLQNKNLMEGAELRITGTATKAAKEKAAVLGWRIVENVQ